jgi:hypothetical protein
VERVTTFADIRVGDTVRLMLGDKPLLVLEEDRTTNLGSYVHLKLSPEPGIEYWRAQPSGTPIILVRRPWHGPSPGVAQGLLIKDIEQWCSTIAALRGLGEIRVLESFFDELLERLLSYELGKPEVKS